VPRSAIVDEMITVLLNPAAGLTQTDDRFALVTQLFNAAGADAHIVRLQFGAQAPDATRSAIADGASAVVAGGGDGTVSSVASVLVGGNTPLGVLPLGTLNHFAKDAGIPQDLGDAVATVVAAHVTSVDVGEVNGRTFVNNSSIGVYPDIVVERETLRKQGYRKWIAFALATARILRRYRGLVVRVTADEATERARTAFVFIGNNEYEVDGLNLGARARLDGGQLVAYLAPRVHARDLPGLLALALAGRAKEGHALESFAATQLHIHTPGRRRLRVALDGEVTVMTRPLRYRTRPRSLRVIVPAR
jgi:diacylglycerol kinase family enzyme